MIDGEIASYPGAIYQVMNRGDHRESVLLKGPQKHSVITLV
ncbi:hypothetical protein Cflav_PD4005 [Pedosphaera parvula Ellin514]|uniref:Uncharacterized protein n=1 Tax=Pedosphaera parvula (strain Ellin514) TaxID=320771 RepID=B9XGR5_PEDPL|nr:hypothetical protein Cflav_PD4005 [Pedosphaera parvula Ellin514]